MIWVRHSLIYLYVISSFNPHSSPLSRYCLPLFYKYWGDLSLSQVTLVPSEARIQTKAFCLQELNWNPTFETDWVPLKLSNIYENKGQEPQIPDTPPSFTVVHMLQPV